VRQIFWHILLLLCALAPGAPAQDQVTEFKKRAALLAGQRLGGGDADRSVQDAAVAFLDATVCRSLAKPGRVSLDEVNARLAELVTQDPPLGESYRVVALAESRLYALVANLGLAGPAALRLYMREEPAAGARPPVQAGCRLVAQVDRFNQPDFFDENLELVPVWAAPAGEAGAVFVTVSGRSDELRTGAFEAWRFHGARLEKLWESELLQNSSYEAASGVFLVTFCSEPDEQRPRICRRMVRERYAWQGGSWSRTEQADVPVRKP
jgi:hypothetical protein